MIMLKNILNLSGVQQLDKRTQLSINGGVDKCGSSCPSSGTCSNGVACHTCSGSTSRHCRLKPSNGIE